jgi:pilus assembly protein CpaB
MGKWKAFIPIILALLVATGGSIFLYKWLQGKTADQATIQAEGDTASIVVAAADLPWGTKLTKEMLKEASFLKESLPGGCQSDPKSLEGRVLIAPLKQKEPVLEYKLAPEDVTVGGVSAILKTGMRAIAVKGDKVIGISGFIQPGNRVDVLVTMKDPKTKNTTTKLVLENILVLATGSEIKGMQDGKQSSVDVYTLEVATAQTEKLALAAAKGKLQFALRNLMDTESVRTKGATIRSTLSSLRGEEEKPVTTKQSKKWVPRYTTIEVIKGGKVTKQKVRL